MRESRLKVAFLSLPPRTHAVLEYFIASTGQGDFQLSLDDASDAAVFDYDNPESRLHWERYHAALDKPGILLSVVEQQVAKTVWVHKPVTPGSMLEAAARIKAGAWCVVPHLPAVTSAPEERRPTPIAQVKPATAVAPASKLTELHATPVSPPPHPHPESRGPTVPPGAVPEAMHVSVKQTSPGVEALPSAAPATRPVAHTSARSPGPVRGIVHQRKRRGGWLRRLFVLLGTLGRRKVRASVAAPEVESVSTGASVTAIEKREPVSGAEAAGLSPEPTVVADSQLADDISAKTAESLELTPASAAPEVTAPLAGAAPEAAGELAPRLKAMPTPAEMEDAPLFCGTRDDLASAEIPRTAELFYPYDYYLVSALREAYLVGTKWRSPTRLDLDLGCLIFVPAENRAYLDFPEEALFEQWVVSQPRRHKVRMVGVQEFAGLQERLDSLTRLDRFDATLWKLGMTTAKGRLPVGTDVTKAFFLKSWPNMTRLQRSPFSLRIAALWATRGASLLETARILEIPQRYVFAFYNAALATDIVTEDGAAVKRAFRKASRNQGRFLNLFKWLRG